MKATMHRGHPSGRHFSMIVWVFVLTDFNRGGPLLPQCRAHSLRTISLFALSFRLDNLAR